MKSRREPQCGAAPAFTPTPLLFFVNKTKRNSSPEPRAGPCIWRYYFPPSIFLWPSMDRWWPRFFMYASELKFPFEYRMIPTWTVRSRDWCSVTHLGFGRFKKMKDRSQKYPSFGFLFKKERERETLSSGGERSKPQLNTPPTKRAQTITALSNRTYRRIEGNERTSY